jgi:hypothetical protein
MRQLTSLDALFLSVESARTYGHFGGSGSFLWIDPQAGVALGCLCVLDFGPWALEAWPRLSDALLAPLS